MALGNWMIKHISKFLTKEKVKKRSYLCDFDRICYEVRNCDVLLIEGNNRMSRVIQRLTTSAWTHSVMYIGRLHDIDDPIVRETVHRHYQGKLNDQLIIESIIGKGTVITPITEYKKDHIRICRPVGLSRLDTQRVINNAVSTLGRNYDVKHIIDLARFILMGRFIPKSLRTRIFNFHPGQATDDICSGMIARAFASVNFPILPLVQKNKDEKLEMIQRNPRLYKPCDFDYSPYFQIIKYPLFSLRQTPLYRDLPWKEGVISNDEIGITETDKKKSQKE